ncbi:hypothetical protein [Nocardia carnea]|uniref:Uncharacterized protein n=1 Tax=Nocardia carnea TaxID=37328 RepID=A0ABW7U0U4_9NOCA|nr:hypothetical protein [Nocardia carnea]
MKDEAVRSYFEAERLSKIAWRGHQQVPTLRAAGVESRTATVLHVHDTQESINEDPVLVLTVELDGLRPELVALVPRIAVPRPGEHVVVVDSPDRSTLLYAGLKLQ